LIDSHLCLLLCLALENSLIYKLEDGNIILLCISKHNILWSTQGIMGKAVINIIGLWLEGIPFCGTKDDKLWLYICPENGALNDPSLKPGSWWTWVWEGFGVCDWGWPFEGSSHALLWGVDEWESGKGALSLAFGEFRNDTWHSLVF